MSTFDSKTRKETGRDSSDVPYRYSLRTLFRINTILAAVLAAAVIMPSGLNQILNGTVWIGGTSWIVIGLVYARGDRRAFYIGAALVVSSIWTGLGGRYMQGFHQLYGHGRLIDVSSLLSSWIDLMVIAATAAINGIFCVYARRYFERNAR